MGSYNKSSMAAALSSHNHHSNHAASASSNQLHHESFLEKIGGSSKVSVITRDGSQAKAIISSHDFKQQQQQPFSTFTSPALRKRNLPLLAQKFKSSQQLQPQHPPPPNTLASQQSSSHLQQQYFIPQKKNVSSTIPYISSRGGSSKSQGIIVNIDGEEEEETTAPTTIVETKDAMNAQRGGTKKMPSQSDGTAVSAAVENQLEGSAQPQVPVPLLSASTKSVKELLSKIPTSLHNNNYIVKTDSQQSFSGTSLQQQEGSASGLTIGSINKLEQKSILDRKTIQTLHFETTTGGTGNGPKAPSSNSNVQVLPIPISTKPSVKSLESTILQKIDESPSWDMDILREITRMVEPLYAAQKLRDEYIDVLTGTNKHGELMEEEGGERKRSADSSTTNSGERKTSRKHNNDENDAGGKIEYNFNLKAYDRIANVPATGLFFIPINHNMSHNHNHAPNSSVKNQNTTSSVNTTNKKQHGTIILPSTRSYAQIHGNSGIGSGSGGIARPFRSAFSSKSGSPPSSHQMVLASSDSFVANEDYQSTQKNEGEDFEEVGVDRKDFAESNEEEKGNYSILTQDHPFAEATVKNTKLEQNHKDPMEVDAQIQEDMKPTTASTSHSSSSDRGGGGGASRQTKYRVTYFPPPDIKLGGLGPDKDSESYLSKLEMAKRKKEYAQKIRDQIKRQFSSASLIGETPTPIPTTQNTNTLRLPAIAQNQTQQTPPAQLKQQRSKSEGAGSISKREKMRQYYSQVKKPPMGSAKTSTFSLPDIRNHLGDDHSPKPNASKRRNRTISAPESPSSVLQRMESEHIRDMKVVEEIRRFYKS